jgi:asparagine synthase (glutamine-hydrolysing)
VRLAIVDLTSGSQPMANEDGRILVVFNGEIYNHRELRRELEEHGHRFSSDHSDTEVIVHGYEEFGSGLVHRLNGMFAFAVWDSVKNGLFLARDRYGIKPLYVAKTSRDGLVFGSEIKAILASGLISKNESLEGLIEYLSFQNLIGEGTMFEGISQFPPGTWEYHTRTQIKREKYWDYAFPRSQRLNLRDAAVAHREILLRVVKRQISADVPVFSYLSGGIDSSAITAAAHRLDPLITCYSCLFDLEGVGEDRMVDEREYSRAVARSLDIQQVELLLPQNSLQSVLGATVKALEFPRMGMAYVNYLIAERVARDGKVVLSGMGGDELHGGYLYRYQMTLPHRQQVKKKGFKALLKGFFSKPPSSGVDVFKSILEFPIKRCDWDHVLTPDILRSITGFRPFDIMDRLFRECPSEDIWDIIMYIDARAYLHGLLVLEDKLSMIHGLETRVPLLDNELVDFILDLPWDLLCDGETGKIVFRESVRPWVPKEIYSKPKMGFGPPDASWYRRALKDFIASVLSEEKIRKRGIFLPEFVQKTLDDHFSGRCNNTPLIWSLLSVENWCDTFGMFEN